MEHELYEVHSSLQQTIERLQEQERQAEARIAELEDQLGKQVTEIQLIQLLYYSCLMLFGAYSAFVHSFRGNS
jgi:thioesterase domain-containing protein